MLETKKFSRQNSMNTKLFSTTMFKTRIFKMKISEMKIFKIKKFRKENVQYENAYKEPMASRRRTSSKYHFRWLLFVKLISILVVCIWKIHEKFIVFITARLKYTFQINRPFIPLMLIFVAISFCWRVFEIVLTFALIGSFSWRTATFKATESEKISTNLMHVH